jgi:hypothetical protein
MTMRVETYKQKMQKDSKRIGDSSINSFSMKTLTIPHFEVGLENSDY